MKLRTYVGGFLCVVGSIAAAIWIGQTPEEADSPVPNADVAAKPSVERPVVASSGPYPRLEVDVAEHEFGTMAVNAEQTHEFIVRNTGAAPLELKKGSSTCKCTSFVVRDAVVEPGDATEVKLSWKPTYASEEFSQVAEVWTNDPDQQPLKLRIKGTVRKEYELQPAGVWDLGAMDEGQQKEFTGYIYSSLLEKCEIAELHADDLKFDLSHVPMTPADFPELEDVPPMDPSMAPGTDGEPGPSPGAAANRVGEKITVKIATSDLEVGPFNDMLSVKLAQTDETIRIPIRGYRTGPVHVVPVGRVGWSVEHSSINLGEISAEAGRSAQLLVFLSSEQVFDLEIGDVEVSPSFLDVKFERATNQATDGKQRCMLKISVPPGSPAGNWTGNRNGTIAIRTNHPDLPELKFRVKFVIL